MSMSVEPTDAAAGRAPKGPRGTWHWTGPFWGRLLTVFVLSFGTPGAADAVAEVISNVAGIECCEDDCDAEGEQGCSGACTHCLCCRHVAGMAVGVEPPAELLLGPPMVSISVFGWHGDRPYASGYRAPPFRPPLA